MRVIEFASLEQLRGAVDRLPNEPDAIGAVARLSALLFCREWPARVELADADVEILRRYGVFVG